MDEVTRSTRSLLDADHFYEEMDLDEDLLDDEGMDDMFSVDLGERDLAGGGSQILASYL